MGNEGSKIIPIIGYVLTLIIPIAGLVYGALLFFFKEDVELYHKHGRLIIYFSIIIFVVTTLIKIIIIWSL